MKKTKKLGNFVILGCLLALGLVVVACKSPSDSAGDPGGPGNPSGTTYTVTFNINGGNGTTPSTQTVSAGAGITLPSGSGLSKGGYSFGGWNTSQSGTGTNYSAGASYTPTVSITLYARWIATGATTYTVTFNTNGGSGTAPADQTVAAGSGIILPNGNGLSKSDSTFCGWNTKDDGTGTNYSAGASYTPTGDIELYAKWDVATEIVSLDRIEYYWVNEHGNLVTTSGGVVSVLQGQTLTITAQSTGYIGRQWYLNGVNTSQSGNTYNFSSTTIGNHTVGLFVEKDGRLYNTNIAITVVVHYTVTFNLNGGSGPVPDSQSVSPGSSTYLPGGSGLIRTGYTFGGWNTNGSGTGTNYNAGASYTPTGDITLYAKWLRTVTIDMYDSYGDGWNGAALRVSVNGTNLSFNATISNGSLNSYSFSVASGDAVAIYWVSGSYNYECSFITYYAGTPPSPAFTTSNNNNWNGSNALVYRLCTTSGTTGSNFLTNVTTGTLLGSFTVQ